MSNDELRVTFLSNEVNRITSLIKAIAMDKDYAYITLENEPSKIKTYSYTWIKVNNIVHLTIKRAIKYRPKAAVKLKALSLEIATFKAVRSIRQLSTTRNLKFKINE